MNMAPRSRPVAASATYGCSPYHVRLQPLSHVVAASVTWGCSLCYMTCLMVAAPIAQVDGGEGHARPIDSAEGL